MASPKFDAPQVSPFAANLVQTSWKETLAKTSTVELAEIFYSKLFTAHPEARELFSETDMKVQRIALISMIDSAIANVNNSALLVPTLFAMGIRHAGYGCVFDHYVFVGDALIATVEQLYGRERFTAELREAWVAVYNLVQTTMWAGQCTEEGKRKYAAWLRQREEKKNAAKRGGSTNLLQLALVAVGSALVAVLAAHFLTRPRA